MTTLLIVDDQAMIRSGLRMILDSEEDFDVVGEAENGAKAIAIARRVKPDIVLMDIRMPEMDGLEATRQITAATAAKVIILTTFDVDEYVYDALRGGASGFLLKDAPADDLIGAIHAVQRGGALIAPGITRRLISEFASRPEPHHTVIGLETLTTREVEVLEQLAQGLSNEEIAERLFVSMTTIKTHVSHILTKLGLRDRVQAVVAAYESGLVG
jgi:DNA-binding NarL/FixJ family response regulator